MKYTLIAQSNQGASVEFKGDTKKECLGRFDSEYSRKGFKIWIESESGVSEVKKSYR